MISQDTSLLSAAPVELFITKLVPPTTVPTLRTPATPLKILLVRKTSIVVVALFVLTVTVPLERVARPMDAFDPSTTRKAEAES